MQHSTLALSTTNLTATHNSCCRNTQQAVPKTNPTASVPAIACLYLKSYACCYLFTYLQCTGSRRNSALTFVINILKKMLHSVLDFHWVLEKTLWLQRWQFSFKLCVFHMLLYWCYLQYREKRLLASVCLSVCLPVFLSVRTEQFFAQ